MAEETQEQITARIVAQAATATAKAVADAAAAAALALASENTTALTAIAVLQTEMEILKTQHSCFEATMNSKMDGLGPKFERIFDKLDGRPSWEVTYALGGLSSLCVGLIVYVVCKL
jgi:flavin-binding protein dodecin